jgi:hypothetical protein
MVAVADLPSADAVIVAVPSATPVTSPVAPRRDGGLVDTGHRTTGHRVIARVAQHRCQLHSPPTSNVSVVGATAMLAIGSGLTVIVDTPPCCPQRP